MQKKQKENNTAKLNKYYSKKSEDLIKRKKELEELRLQTDSQNTKLLKIQQEERDMNQLYFEKKMKMENTLEELAEKAEQFNQKQKEIAEDLDSKKETLIMKNDQKKKFQEQKLKEYQELNKKKMEQIAQLKQQNQKLEDELNLKLGEISKYKEIEEFLQKVVKMREEMNKQPKEEESDGVKKIIDQFDDLVYNKQMLGNNQRNIEKLRDEQKRQIELLGSEMERQEQVFNIDIAKLQAEIEELMQQNREIEAELQDRKNEQLGKTKNAGKIIRAIEILYFKMLSDSELKKGYDISSMKPTDILLNKLEFITERIQFLTIIVKKFDLKKFQESIGYKEN